ncbi:hypothetical protein GCM10009853_024430 [Glycomyces scopariae]|uniref:DUF4097 domain-containing protein n=1 Tax=Glycomyces sambucus TaxID=380244 RepID=A0A1G9M7N7_9ACTN|nr:DUF4097 family beta strand repeat-containing protein [Glycomyces sambucus]SDL70312.1 hypothetical protein SAMN05216298_4908 [Glycomyces sambucus]
MIDTPAKPAAPESPEPAAYPARKVWWILGGSITGAALVTGVAIFGSWSWVVSSTDEDETRTKEYDQAVDAVDVRADVGDIAFEAVDGTALEFQLKTRWLGEEPETREDWDGDVFSATGECAQGRFFGLDVDQCQTNYVLGLPAGTDATAETDVGTVSLEGVDGAVDVETGVGDVVGEDLRATSTTIESGVGSVTLEYDQVLGDIVIDAGTGDVIITVPDDGTTYDVDFEGGVGDRNIEIATDPSVQADYTIAVTSGVGSLTVRYGH